MKKGKKIYFGLLLIIVFLISTMYFSYAFFTSKNEEHGKLNIVAGTLDYKIESSDLEDNQITVLANEIEKVELSITSLNSIKSLYELYYNTKDNNDLEIGYSIDTNDTISGEIESDTKKKITVIIKNNSDTDKTISFGVQGGLISNDLALTEGKSLNNEIDLCTYEAGEVFTFDYTGNSQLFTTLCEGNYQVELWGASGGDYEENLGGQGGYTKGTIYLDQAENFYLYVGSQPTDYNGGYNGGAQGGVGTDGKYTGGGGATDIRLNRGEWNDFDSLKSRLMVSSAGAGTGMYSNYIITGGSSGGLEGYVGELISGRADTVHTIATAGTQISGGLTINGSSGDGSGKFGYADGYNATGYGYGTGGASGYYGGGTGWHTASNVSSGAGGSSFISGHDGCDAIKEESTSDNIIHTGQSIHYSGYLFTDTVMIDGAGYNWTTEKGSEIIGMPTHDGNSTMIGNSGNGYAKITYLGKIDNIDEILDYNLESENLENNEITVAANTMQKITVDVNSLSKISSNYELYYTTDDLTDLTVGYGDENNETTGIIGTNSTKTVNIYIRNTSNESKSLTFNVNGSLNSIELDETAKEISNLCTENTIYNFDYIGDSENFITPCSGNYILESWGAQGGVFTEYNTAYGGYSKGTINLDTNRNLFVVVGGQGEAEAISNGLSTSECSLDYINLGGYNGGGYGTKGCNGSHTNGGAGGGGATHISTINKILSEIGSENLSEIFVVAGGGGGSYYNSYGDVSSGSGGNGGGFQGGVSTNIGSNCTNCSTPANQTSGYAFGLGANPVLDQTTAGGGGGLYGGYADDLKNGGGWIAGGGGSGYIGNELLTNKAMYCYDCDESEEESTKTISTTNVSEEATSEYAKIGNGYAKITYLGKEE